VVRYLIPLLIILGCSTPQYRWYGLDLPSYEEGKLLGPKEKHDLPISVCKPDLMTKGKCIVFKVEEFERILADLVRLQVVVDACQKKK